MQTILITGINGFLGSHLAKAFSSQFNIIGIEQSLENNFRLKDCNFQVFNNKSVKKIFLENRIDIIIHTATLYGKNNEDIYQLFDANVCSPLILLNEAIKHNCQLFINTDTVLDRFVNPYALTKRHFQEWLYLGRDEINVINIKLEHFFGPGASETNFITGMIQKLRNNEQINLTKGEQMRNFIYIDDVIAAYKTVIEKHHYFKEKFSDFNVCTNQLISIKDLMILLKRLTNSNSRLKFGVLNYRENELMESGTDNSAMLSIGWKPNYSIEEGIKLTCLQSENLFKANIE